MVLRRLDRRGYGSAPPFRPSDQDVSGPYL